MSDQATLGGTDNPVSMLPQTGVAQELIATATLSQDFNDCISTVVSVEQGNWVTIDMVHTPHASQTGGVVNVIVLFSRQRTAPAIGDDAWYPPSIETAASAGALPGTKPTGADWDNNPPNWTPHAVAPKYWTLPATDGGGTEVVRLPITTDCSEARWMYVAAIQQVDVTSFGTASATYTLSL